MGKDVLTLVGMALAAWTLVLGAGWGAWRLIAWWLA